LRSLTIGSISAAATAALVGLACAAPPSTVGRTAASAGNLAWRAQQLLEQKCVTCHGEKVQSSGLRLDSRAALLKGGKRGPSFVPSRPEKSLLLTAVHFDGPLKMPPAGKLADAEIRLLTEWIRGGATWPERSRQPAVGSRQSAGEPNSSAPAALWALAPIRRPQIPSVRNRAWVKNPIDAFVLARLEREGLKPSPYADRRTLIRRVSLDLTGLPPRPEEVEAFVSDRAPNAYEKVVDRLLASPAYGERMAQHWLDLARYADSDGYHDDTTRYMHEYRDYVITAFNENKPFDRFTIEQLAGDLIPNATIEQKIASAFNRCGPTSSEGGAVLEEYAAKYAVDRVNTTGAVWLGLTVQCAECHDHKYDPIRTKEYYQLFAFFNQVPEEILYRGSDAPPVLRLPTPEQQAKLDELTRRAGELETALKSCAPAAAEETKKKLEEVKKAQGEVEKTVRKIRIMADVPERRPTHVLLRGDYRNKGEEVQPGVPAVLGALPAGMKGDRLALATWLVDPKNPLPARVTVNRFWQMLFGRGIVGSSDDLGTRGERPTHPELLDYMASVFSGTGASVGGDRGRERPRDREKGGAPEALLSPSLPPSVSPSANAWDVKAILRLIVTSATYQQSSRLTREMAARDPENRLLARGPRFRLAAEVIRDNALAISGLLDRERPVGGPSVKPYQPGDLWRELSAGDQADKSYVQDHGPDLYRRGLYTFWKRSILHPAFAVFDAPKREVCVGRRPITNTPLQAFVTLNDTQYVEAARVFAQLLMQKGGPAFDSRLDLAYRRALARPASGKERDALRRLYHDALAQYRQDARGAEALVSVGEAPRPKDLDVVELAAWTCVCNAVLNLDEVVTRE
jgi:mono/diheme cytochrome c family protein